MWRVYKYKCTICFIDSQDKEDYIKKAVSLARDEKDLTKIRKNIYENALKTPLFDKKKFSDEFFSNLEKIYN